MLQVLGYKLSQSETVEVGQSIPLNVEWNKPVGSLLYWRSGDIVDSFMEVGIDSETGVISSLSLILAPVISYNFERTNYPSIQQALGIPICDLSRWKNFVHLDDPHSFEVSVTNNSLLIDFTPKPIITNIIVTGRTRFGIDIEGDIYSIEVVGFSRQELLTLREYHNVVGWVVK